MQQPFVPRKEHTSFLLAVFVKIGQKPIVVNVRQRMAPGRRAVAGVELQGGDQLAVDFI